MHANLQSAGRSPKPTNGPASTSHFKAGSESIQNSVSSFLSQAKGKKRDRGEQGTEAVKRECITKTDDVNSGNLRQESLLKSEIAKITEKGGIVDSEGVERLVQLMVPNGSDKKIDLAGRSMVAGVIAATDKFDCLSQFVELRGLPVFDEWLQEIHWGKVGEGGGSKDRDKSVEEFLLVLLHALEKLPVNLQALQMCNIGKSVNHLRSHKNSEIQKKSRSLVDTWKKRVEAEMNINDVKSGSNQVAPWHGRPRPEVGNRHSGGSSDVAMKSSVAQISTSKSAPVKIFHGKSTTRSASASLGSVKSVPSPVSASTNLKDGHLRNSVGGGSMSDVPSTPMRDEKGSGSSQSHNNSQSWSNDHARTGGVFGKDDARSSSAGSMKGLGGSSRSRKSINGFQGSGTQRENGSSRNSSLHKNPAADKSLQSGLTSEKVLDATTAEGNSHKCIVRITNRSHSPGQSSRGSFEDPSFVSSRASSPAPPEKHDQFDRNSKDKSDTYCATVTSDVNAESWQSNDLKDVLNASYESDGSCAAVTDENRCRTGEEAKKVAEASKPASSSSGNEPQSQEACFGSMHALVESCAKYSETNASVSTVDDLCMNLLANVAAGEISKSDLVSPMNSPQRNTTTEIASTGNDPKLSPADDLARNQILSAGGADVDLAKPDVSGHDGAKDRDDNSLIPSEQKPIPEHPQLTKSSSMDSQKSDGHDESKAKSNEAILAPPVLDSPSMTSEKTIVSERGKRTREKSAVGGLNADASLEVKQNGGDVAQEIGTGGSHKEVKTESVEGSTSCVAQQIESKIKYGKTEGVDSNVQIDEKPTVSAMDSESVKGTCEEVWPFESSKDLVSEKIHEMKTEKPGMVDTKSHENDSENQRTERESNAPVAPENKVVAGSSSGVTHRNSEHVERNLESKEIERCGEPAPHKLSSDVQDSEEHVRPKNSKLTGMETDETGECTSTSTDGPSNSVAGALDVDSKVGFDLNEGFNVDDRKYGEPKTSAPEISFSGCLISPLPFPASSLSSGLPASITVAAAAKRSFLPPNDLLWNKGELGWKRSADTSAFRPVEPRKVLDMPSGAMNILHAESTTGKQGRPFLDIDLNIPDERVLEDMGSRYVGHETSSASAPDNSHDLAPKHSTSAAPVCSSGGLDLDLNQVDKTSDIANYTMNNGRRLDVPILQAKLSSGGTSIGEVGVRRNFDLNDGPVLDDENAELALFGQQARSSVPSQPPASGLRMNNTEAGTSTSLFQPGTTYPVVTIPSIMLDRGEQQPFPIVAAGGPQTMLGPTNGGNPFSPDLYRGPVLPASPAVPFPSTSFQYPVFSYGTSFSLPPTTLAGFSTYLDSSSVGRLGLPSVHPQLSGPAGGFSFSHLRPYHISLQDGSNNSSSDRKQGREGLDQNMGS